MVYDSLTTVVAGFLGAINDRLKMAVLGVFENSGQLPRQPVFVAAAVKVTQAFECCVMLFRDGFFFHGVFPPDGMA